jgi:hypothetical protein
MTCLQTSAILDDHVDSPTMAYASCCHYTAISTVCLVGSVARAMDTLV